MKIESRCIVNKSKRVVICGDSFGKKNITTTKSTWPEMIANHYEVHNFAGDGTSIDWSLQQLLLAVESNLHGKSTVLIFFATDPSRQNWLFFKENHQFLSKWLFDPPFSWTKDKQFQETIAPYLKFKKFSKTFFKNLDSKYEMREIKKTVGMINLLAGMFEKILIVPCFQEIDLTTIKLHNNVTIWTPMIYISGKQTEYNDNLYNHLNEKTHKVFYNKLKNWIENDVQI